MTAKGVASSTKGQWLTPTSAFSYRFWLDLQSHWRSRWRHSSGRTGKLGARVELDAGPGASVAELVDAGDWQSPGGCSTGCMPCGFDSRLGHHQFAVARRGRGKADPAPQTLVQETMPPIGVAVNISRRPDFETRPRLRCRVRYGLQFTEQLSGGFDPQPK